MFPCGNETFYKFVDVCKKFGNLLSPEGLTEVYNLASRDQFIGKLEEYFIVLKD
jgi:hypothetical protein